MGSRQLGYMFRPCIKIFLLKKREISDEGFGDWQIVMGSIQWH